MKIKLIFLFLFFAISSCCSDPLEGSFSDSECIDTNCADYSSRVEAQSDFDWNPECRGDLDADNDGLACEESNWTSYYSSISSNSSGGSNSGGSNSGGSGCPTTSNCGCSGINKSPCQSNSCCRWVTGSGCRCR